VLVGIVLFFFPSGLKFWIHNFFYGNFVVPLNNIKLNRIGIWCRFPAIASAGSASPLSCTVKLSMLPEVEA
jgi:hypothetical protein